MNEFENAIKKLEALRDEAFYKSTHRHGAYAANRSGQYTAYHKAVEIIKEAVRVDAVEVVHGRWEPCAIQPNGFVGSYRCTTCGNASINDSNYCPHCGAKMDGGNEDGLQLQTQSERNCRGQANHCRIARTIYQANDR